MTSDAQRAHPITRRDAIGLLALGAGLAMTLGASRPADPSLTPDPGSRSMTIACFIHYQIDPVQRDAFAAYAAAWGRIIPRCGGHLIGYFLPYEGTNDVAWGLIAFESLAAYEQYRARLRTDPEARANFAAAQRARCILREERTFVELVEGTFELPSTLQPGG